MAGSVFKRWRDHLRNLRDDTSGGVMILFAGGAMALALIAAGSIEVHRRGLAKNELQNAADAAALAGKQRQVVLSAKIGAAGAKAQGKQAAKDMFEQSIALSKNFAGSTVTATYTWNADNSFTVTSQPNYTIMFGTLLPSNVAQLNVRATVDFSRSTPTEVALVLDNTMSMFAKDGRPETRFTLLRNAAKKFTHQVFDAAQVNGDPNLVRVSVVPWATSVNVLGPAPAAADFSGTAAVTTIPDWGSQLAVTSPMARGAQVSGTGAAIFKPVDWRGCVSGATENPTDYTNSAKASWDALFVPPLPQHMIVVNEGPLVSTPVTTCTCTASDPVPCGPPAPGTQGFHRLIEKAVPQITNARLLLDKNVEREGEAKVEKAQCTTCTATSCTTANQMLPDCTTPTATRSIPYCHYYSNNGRLNSYTPSAYACTEGWHGCYAAGAGPVADKTKQACVADPNEPKIINNTVNWCEQYYQTNAKVWDQPKEIGGPNLNCPAPMLGLTGNRTQVIQSLDRMYPVPGGTHADVGLRWGLRTLSKDNSWPAFFGLTKTPEAWGSAAQKVMILITDGENEQAQQFPGYWGCSDTYNPGCVTSPDGPTLDTRMQGWCDAIRTTYQIEIYAIAVNFSNAAAVTRLQNCAGKPSNVFNVDASDLNAVLSGIASRVMAMRLTQ